METETILGDHGIGHGGEIGMKISLWLEQVNIFYLVVVFNMLVAERPR